MIAKESIRASADAATSAPASAAKPQRRYSRFEEEPQSTEHQELHDELRTRRANQIWGGASIKKTNAPSARRRTDQTRRERETGEQTQRAEYRPDEQHRRITTRRPREREEYRKHGEEIGRYRVDGLPNASAVKGPVCTLGRSSWKRTIDRPVVR